MWIVFLGESLGEALYLRYKFLEIQYVYRILCIVPGSNPGRGWINHPLIGYLFIIN